MTEPGGSANQDGIYFQNCTTVLRIAEMLSVSLINPHTPKYIVSVRVEAPKIIDDTVVTWSTGIKEYIQAKLSISPGSKEWNSLWNNIHNQYKSRDFNKIPNGDRITLAVRWSPLIVSIQGALIVASTSENLNEWYQRLNQRQKQIVSKIKNALNIEDEEFFDFLKYVQIWILTFEGDPMETDTFERETCRILSGIVTKPDNIFPVLMNMVGNKARIRGVWQYSSVVKEVSTRGYQILNQGPPDPPHEFVLLDPNPYTFGPPLRQLGDLFIGRDGLLDDITYRMRKHYHNRNAPNAILLYGPHRSGRSSILYQLGFRISNEYRPIYVTLESIEAASETPDVIGAIVYLIEDSLREAGINVNTPGITEFKAQPVSCMTKFLHNIVSACLPCKPLLMFDEADILSHVMVDPRANNKFIGYMRSLIEQIRDIFFVFASRQDIRRLVDPEMSRLLTLVSDHIRVDILSKSATDNLIIQPVQNYFSYSDEALSLLVRLSGRYPCFVQLLCWQTVEWRNIHHENLITKDLLEQEIIPDAIAIGNAQFSDLWGGLTRDEQSILNVFCNLLEEGRETVPKNDIRMKSLEQGFVIRNWDLGLEKLLYKGLLEFRGNELYLQLGLLKHWIDRSIQISMEQAYDFHETRINI